MLRLLALALADVAAGVLVVAGLIKLFDPRPWVAAVRALGVPLGTGGAWVTTARAAGMVEILLAGAVWFIGSSASLVALAAVYALFVAVSLAAWRAGGVSCGCFGVRSAPISGMHAALDAVFVVGAVLAALDDPASLPTRLDQGVGAAVAYLTFVVIGVAAVISTMTTAADLVAVRRSVVGRAAPTSKAAAR